SRGNRSAPASAPRWAMYESTCRSAAMRTDRELTPAELDTFAAELDQLRRATLADLLRNLWTFLVIFCGHFTERAAVFPKESVEGESRGHWYLRQLRGSSNLDGGRLFHILTGNLSHQIEHHLFPDLPARRYAELAPKVREIAARYGQDYNSGTLWGQFATVLRRIWIYRLPPVAQVQSPAQ